MNALYSTLPAGNDEKPVFAYPLHWAQTDAVRSLADGFDAGHKRQYVDMPTGTGKTAVPLSMMEMMRSAGRAPRVLIMTNTRALVGQIMDEIAEFTPKLAPQASRYVVSDETMKTPVAVSTYKSGMEALEKGLLRSSNFDFIVLDEAHHALSELRDAILQNAECPVIALTATPDFNARKGLRNAGYHEAFHVSLQKAEETGLICPTRNILLTIDDEEYALDDVKVVGRSEEYDDDALEPILTREGLGNSVASFYKNWRDPDTGRRLADMVGVAYCNSIKHAQLMEEQINKALIDDVPVGVLPARAVWGTMPPNTLNQLLLAHKNGTIRHLMSVDYLIEGYNNRKIEAIFNIRPTRSNVVAGQRPGRGARLDPANPDKINKVFDVIYPAKVGRSQILYADTLSLDVTSKDKAHLAKQEEVASFGDEPKMKVHQSRSAVGAYISERNRKSLRLSGLTSDHVLPSIAKAMLDCKPPFTNGADLARAIRKQIDATPWPDKVKKAASDYALVLKVMTGKETMTQDGTDYSLTAYAVSALLSVGLEDLFGKTREEMVRDMSDDGIVDDRNWLRQMSDEDGLLYDDPDDVATPSYDDQREMIHIERRDKDGVLTGFDGRLCLDEAESDDLVNEDSMNAINRQKEAKVVQDQVSDLTPREALVVRLRMGFGGCEETLENIGDLLSVGKERARQIDSKAIRKLKHSSRSDPLRQAFYGETKEYGLKMDIERVDQSLDERLKKAFSLANHEAGELYRAELSRVEHQKKRAREEPDYAERIDESNLKMLSALPKEYNALSDFMQRARGMPEMSVEGRAYSWLAHRMIVKGPGKCVLSIR